MTTATRVGTGARARLYASTTNTYDGDLDYIAIEYAMNGEPVDLAPAERLEAARLLHARGVGLEEIGRRVGVVRSTVADWRDKNWQPPQPKSDQEPIDIGNAKHGRPGYSKGCRCRTCRDGAAEASRQRRARARAKAA